VRFAAFIVEAGLALTAFVGLPIAASAGDWTATANFGETVEANDNPQLQSKNSPGGSVGSITNLSLQALDTGPTWHWLIGTDLGFQKFWGPGAQDSFDGVRGGVIHTAVDKATPLTDYYASFAGSVLPASVSEIFDSGITNADTTTINYAGQGGLTHHLNALNSLGLNVSGASQSFTGGNRDGLTPNTYLTTGQSWTHTLTPRTGFTLAASTAWYTASGVSGTDSVSESVTGQLATQLSERMSLAVGGGGFFIHTTGDDAAGENFDSNNSGYIANGRLSYALGPTTSISAFASHNLAPSSLGSVQELTQVGFGVGHQINEFSSWFFGGIFLDQLPVTSISTTGNTQRQAVALSVGYNRNLSRFWNMQLSYNFTQQDNGNGLFFASFDDNGSASSNAVFLTFSRSFNLLGSPVENASADIRQGFTDLVAPAAPIRTPDVSGGPIGQP
jgi:hypothetical protein